MEETEGYFRLMTEQLSQWTPEGIIEVDLPLLGELNLLNFSEEAVRAAPLDTTFEVMVTAEKITLVNELFIVWIVPLQGQRSQDTYTIISQKRATGLHLELIFSNRGVYNSSKIVLRVLEYYLKEICENEQMLQALEYS